MRCHFGAGLAVAMAASAALSLAVTPLAGQSRPPQTPAADTRSKAEIEAAKEAERKLILDVAEGQRRREAALALPTDVKNWKPERTPWGDPDLAGVYSNSDESGVPFERPAQFEGRKLEDFSAAEITKLREARRNATIDRAASAVEDPHGHPQLFWWENLNSGGSRAWLVVDPPDGKIPALTPQARERAAARADARRRSGRGPADAPSDRSLYDRCITRGIPGSMMPAIYGSSYEIVQSPTSVAILYEMIHETRVIPMDGRGHVAKGIATYMGDPRGHWEGDTLVVETTNFKEQTAYRGASGETLRLIERFKPIGPSVVEWSVTVNDPATWARPWTFAMNLTKKDGSQRPFEYACHEGNYAMFNILSGARADEKADAEAAAKGLPPIQRDPGTGPER
jgi:hypothetical protein